MSFSGILEKDERDLWISHSPQEKHKSKAKNITESLTLHVGTVILICFTVFVAYHHHSVNVND